MLAAVEFDRQSRIATGKTDDERGDDELAGEG